ELADGAGVAGQRDGFVLVHFRLLWGPGRSRVMVLKSAGLRFAMWRVRAGERIRRVRNLTPRSSSSPSTAWVVTFWSMTSIAGSFPLAAFQWSQNAITSRAWVALEVSALA